MNDEVPDEGDFDAGRRRGEFDDITPEDFIRGIGNPPGWLASGEINRMRGEMPIPYVLVVPVRTDDLGRVSQVGSLLRVSDDGSIERTLIAGRVLTTNRCVRPWRAISPRIWEISRCRSCQ